MRLVKLIICCMLLWPTLVWSQAQTHSTVPQSNSSFISDLQTFLRAEDANRYSEQFNGFVVSGGVDGVGGTLTHTPTALTAYPSGYYTTESGSVVYIANSTCYLIVHRLTTGNLGTFQRQPGTHYLTDCTSPTKPALPADSLWLATIVTNGSSVTAVTDLRTRVPYAGSYLFDDLPSAGVRGRVVIAQDVNSGTLFWDNGSAWQQVTANPMSAVGDMIVGGTGGAPSRLIVGSANQVLGVNGAGTSQEYKSIVAGAGISVLHSAGGMTLSVVDATPPGALLPYAGISAPSGWLLANAAAIVCSTYPNLAAVLIPSASIYGRGTAVGDFTVNVGTDVITLSAHGLLNGTIVHVASTNTLPTGLSANTLYYVRDVTTSTFRLAVTSGGVAIDLTSAGSGTHSLYDEVNLPDMRSRVAMGAGTGTFASSFVPADVNTGTEIITIPTNTTFYTGTAVVYTSTGTVVTGLTGSATYYTIRMSATTIKLASSLANALAGTAINLTGTGTGIHTITQTLTARSIGDRGGEEAHTQLNGEVGIHNHGVTDPGHTHNMVAGTGSSSTEANYTAATSFASVANEATSSSTTGVTINNSAAPSGSNIIQPFVALNYIIKTRGHAWTHRRPIFAHL